MGGQEIRLRYGDMHQVQWINQLKKKNKANFVKNKHENSQ